MKGKLYQKNAEEFKVLLEPVAASVDVAPVVSIDVACVVDL